MFNKTEWVVSGLLVILGCAAELYFANLATGQPTTPAAATISPTQLGLIPAPRQVIAYQSTWTLPQTVAIEAVTADERNVAAFLADFLAQRGIKAGIVSQIAGRTQISLSSQGVIPQVGSEGYKLTVDQNGISISANDGAGLFYGLQTLEELFSSDSLTDNTIHQVSIIDWPEFKWRGVMLDVSRHFFPVPVVQRYIDLAAHYKLNVFHWHLTDNDGWRIEIPQYPLLTKIGSNLPGCMPGFYTDDQIKQIVAYAAARYVTIMPEIDMPAHETAAIAAYPWLGAAKDTLLPSDRTIEFFENVLTEVMKLFPGQYISVGGDEVHYESIKGENVDVIKQLMQQEHLSRYPQLESYLLQQIGAFLKTNGRRMAGWDEIAAGGALPDSLILCWHKNVGAQAVAGGNNIVMCTSGSLYFDYAQGDPVFEPPAMDGFTTLHMVYNFNPSASLSAAHAGQLIGVQANEWTEYISTENHLFYMLLPRALALAEIAWTPQQQHNWPDFVMRTGKQYLWLQNHDFNFRVPEPNWQLGALGKNDVVNRMPKTNMVRVSTKLDKLQVTLSDAVPGAVMHVLFSCNQAGLPSYIDALEHGDTATISVKPGQHIVLTATAALNDGRTSAPTILVIDRPGFLTPIHS
ncbi:MAG TPA: beta-N-acetylhexosaminidase [Phycisphaerae bacterium]|nr:beta-N-acetylhexosaminidase [Phycisphaerae bacterium]